MAAQHGLPCERPEPADERPVEPGLQLWRGDGLTPPDQIQIDAVLATGNRDVERLGADRGMQLPEQQLEKHQ